MKTGVGFFKKNKIKGERALMKHCVSVYAFMFLSSFSLVLFNNIRGVLQTIGSDSGVNLVGMTVSIMMP